MIITGKRKLSLYTPCANPLGSACTYYRQTTPWKTLAEMGLAEYKQDDLHSKHAEDRQMWMAYADIHQYYLNLSPGLMQRINQFKRWKIGPDATGELRIPPSVVFDADDHIEYVDVFNPKFSTLGTRLPDGTVLEPGAQVHAQLDDGTQQLVWEDGKEYQDGVFDVQFNHRKFRLLKMISRAAHGVSVTTEELAKVYRGYGCKNVHVFPNSLREADYPYIPIQREDDVVRVLWQGGYSHFVDWAPLREALGRVFSARPKARLVVWGMLFPGVHRAVPEEQLEFIPWDDYSKFTLRLATMRHHINLCPLTHNENTVFNRTKSPIKFLESSAITVPAATLAADGPVYGPAIDHGDTGLLYSGAEDFAEKLAQLIDDAALRESLSRRAHEAVWDRWNVTNTIAPLYEWYQELRATRSQGDVMSIF